MNGKTSTCRDAIVSATVLLLYTISLVLPVLYTVTVYPVISPLGWVVGFQEMAMSSVCILVSGSKVYELSLKDAFRSCMGPGSKWEIGQDIYQLNGRRKWGIGGGNLYTHIEMYPVH